MIKFFDLFFRILNKNYQREKRNMGVLLKIALRNMKRRKVRYILTTITLVISVALFGGVMIVSDSFEVMLNQRIKQFLMAKSI